MNDKQQTAVDILCGKLAMKLGIPQAITFYIDHQEEIREAKEMFEQQLIDAHLCGQNSAEEVDGQTEIQYYQQTYGGGEQ